MRKVLLGLALVGAFGVAHADRPANVDAQFKGLAGQVMAYPDMCVTFANRRDTKDSMTQLQMWQLGYCEALAEAAIQQALLEAKPPKGKDGCYVDVARALNAQPNETYGQLDESEPGKSQATAQSRLKELRKLAGASMKINCK